MQFKRLMDRIALLKLYTGILEEKYSVGVSTSGHAPIRKVAKEVSEIFGGRVGILEVKTASWKKGYPHLNVCQNHPKKGGAIEPGKKLADRCKKNGKKCSLKHEWINFFRKPLLKKLITRNKERIAGVLEIWKKKGWL